jgi:hypothetical protein
MPEWATVCLRGLGTNPVRAKGLLRRRPYERFVLILFAESLNVRFTVGIEESLRRCSHAAPSSGVVMSQSGITLKLSVDPDGWLLLRRNPHRCLNPRRAL